MAIYLNYSAGVISYRPDFAEEATKSIAAQELLAESFYDTNSEGDPVNQRVSMKIISQLVQGKQVYFLAETPIGQLFLNDVACTSIEDFNTWFNSSVSATDNYELLANKATNLTSPNNTKYPTTAAVSTALSAKLDASAVVDTAAVVSSSLVPSVAMLVSYVDNAIIYSSAPDDVAIFTLNALPNTPTYSNGSSGVGATLTAASNSVLTIDGEAVSNGNRIGVGGQATGAHNGIYTVTSVGVAGVSPWVLTRATDYDDAASINSSRVIPAAKYVGQYGLETNVIFVLVTAITTVGTDSFVFTQYTNGVNVIVVKTDGLDQFPDDSTTYNQLQALISDKTLANLEDANTWAKAQSGSITTLTDAATIVPDFFLSNDFKLLITGTRTLGEPTNIRVGQAGCITIKQPVAGGAVLNYAWCYVFAGGTAPVIDATKAGRSELFYNVTGAMTGTCTISISTPAVVTKVAHGLDTGDRVQFTTTGALPTGLSANTTYWVTKVDADTFRLSASLTDVGTPTFINTSGSQSGTHTVKHYSITIGAALAVKA